MSSLRNRADAPGFAAARGNSIRRPCLSHAAWLRALCTGAALSIWGVADADIVPIELCNGFYAPDGRPTGFEWDFAGDVTGGIAAQPDDDPGINPWAWMNIHFGSSVNPTTVTYDSVNDVTRVLESGDPLPAVPASYTPWALDIYNNPTYHTCQESA